MNTVSIQSTTSIDSKEHLFEWLCLGAIITTAYIAIPRWLVQMTWYQFPESMRTREWFVWYHELLSLAFAFLLVSGSLKRSGLRLGTIKHHWRGVLVVCSIPIILTALINPFLPEKPFANASFHMWLTSPLHQDLIFSGFLYGRLVQVAPSYLHKKIRIRWALILTAAFFSLHHLANIHFLSGGYLIFQLIYSFLGLLLVGLSRQWTGTILYVLFVHVSVNLIGWLTS